MLIVAYCFVFSFEVCCLFVVWSCFVRCVLFVVCCLRFVVCRLSFVARCLRLVACCSLFVVCCLLSDVR